MIFRRGLKKVLISVGCIVVAVALVLTGIKLFDAPATAASMSFETTLKLNVYNEIDTEFGVYIEDESAGNATRWAYDVVQRTASASGIKIEDKNVTAINNSMLEGFKKMISGDLLVTDGMGNLSEFSKSYVANMVASAVFTVNPKIMDTEVIDNAYQIYGTVITSSHALSNLKDTVEELNKTIEEVKVNQEVYASYTGSSAASAVLSDYLTVTAKKVGEDGENISVQIIADESTMYEEGKYAVYEIKTLLNGEVVDSQKVGKFNSITDYTAATVGDLKNNDWVIWSGNKKMLFDQIGTITQSLKGGKSDNKTMQNTINTIQELVDNLSAVETLVFTMEDQWTRKWNQFNSSVSNELKPDIEGVTGINEIVVDMARQEEQLLAQFDSITKIEEKVVLISENADNIKQDTVTEIADVKSIAENVTTVIEGIRQDIADQITENNTLYGGISDITSDLLELKTEIDIRNGETNNAIETLNNTITGTMASNYSVLEERLTSEYNTLQSELKTSINTVANDTSENINTLSNDTAGKINTLISDTASKINSLANDTSGKIDNLTNETNTKINDFNATTNKKIDNLAQDTENKINSLGGDANVKIDILKNETQTNMDNLKNDTNTKINELSDNTENKLQALKGNTETKIGELKTDNETKYSQLQQSVTSTATNAQTNLENARSLLSASITSTSNDLSSYITSNNAAIASINKRIDDLESLFNTTSAVTTQLVDNLITQAGTLTTDTIKTNISSNVTELTNTLTNLRNEMSSLKSTLGSTAEEEVIKTNISNVIQDIINCQDDVENYKSSLSTRINGLDDTLITAQTNISTMNETTRQSLLSAATELLGVQKAEEVYSNTLHKRIQEIYDSTQDMNGAVQSFTDSKAVNTRIATEVTTITGSINTSVASLQSQITTLTNNTTTSIADLQSNLTTLINNAVAALENADTALSNRLNNVEGKLVITKINGFSINTADWTYNSTSRWYDFNITNSAFKNDSHVEVHYVGNPGIEPKYSGTAGTMKISLERPIDITVESIMVYNQNPTH